MSRAPNTPTNPVVEMKLNGQWVDVSADCRLNSADSGGGIAIKRGRSNEAPRVEPTSVDLVLNNGESNVSSTLDQIGIYSERNPNSPYYGQIGRNISMRVGLDRVNDEFARTLADWWGLTPDVVNTENVTVPGHQWNIQGTVGNFDTTGTTATIQAATGFQAASFGTYGDVDVITKVKVSDRTSEFGVVLRIDPYIPDQPDGTFESGVGQFTPTGSTLVSSTAQVRFGSKSALITATGSPTEVKLRHAYANRISVVAGQSYKVRCWVQQNATGNVTLGFDWYDASGVYISTSNSGSLGVTSGVWSWLEFTVAAVAGATTCTAGPSMAASPPNGRTMYVDNLQVMQTSPLSYYTAYVTCSTTDLIRIGRVSSDEAFARSSNLAANVIAGSYYWIHAQASGQRMRARFWKDGDDEPTTWNTTFFDDRVPLHAAIPMSGEVGLFAKDGGALVTFESIRVDQWRAHAEVVQLPVRFDLSRQDHWVPVSASGVLRRLGQGRKNLQSAVYLHLAQYSPIGVWLPLEAYYSDAAASNAASGGSPGSVHAITYNTPDTTGANALPGVAGFAHFDDATSYVTAFAPAAQPAQTAWTVLNFFRLDSTPASDILLFTYTTTGTARYFLVYLQLDKGVRVEARSATNALLSSQVSAMWGFSQIPEGSWVANTLYIFQSGGTVQWAWNYHNPNDLTGSFFTANGSFTGTIGIFKTFDSHGSAAATAVGGMSLSNVFHYIGNLPFVTNAFALAARAYQGETTVTRFGRLLDGANVPWSIHGNGGEAMGAQLPSKLLDLLDDCADVEHGFTSEARDSNELEFHTRSSLYNARTVTLDLDAGHLIAPLEPTPDDQGTRNNVTVSMPSGALATSIQTTGPLNINVPEDDPDGVGDYASAEQVNFSDPDDLQSAADWRRSVGTVPDPRYPSMAADLTSSVYEDPLMSAEVYSLDTGRMIDLANPEVSPDSFAQLIQAYTETIDQYDWFITWTTTPGTTYENMGLVSHTTRVSPYGSVTAASFVSGTNTALSVQRTVTPYGLWVPTSVDAAVANFDIMVAGVQLHVTNVSGTSDPQTLTVSATPVNGVIKTIPANSPITLAEPWRVAW